jgi:hypothetical protein
MFANDDNYYSPCINDILDNTLEHRSLSQAVLEVDLNECEDEIIPFGGE